MKKRFIKSKSGKLSALVAATVLAGGALGLNYFNSGSAVGELVVKDEKLFACIMSVMKPKYGENVASYSPTVAQANSFNDEKGIDCSGKGISDLTGIENFTSLPKLNLSGNKIKDGVSKLSSLTGLTDLNLSSNSIENVSALAGLTKLKVLNLASNNLKSISSIKKASMPALDNVNIDNNKVLDISSLSGVSKVSANKQNFEYPETSKIGSAQSLGGVKNKDGKLLRIDNVSQITPQPGAQFRLGQGSSAPFVYFEAEGNYTIPFDYKDGFNGSMLVKVTESGTTEFSFVGHPGVEYSKPEIKGAKISFASSECQNFKSVSPVEPLPGTVGGVSFKILCVKGGTATVTLSLGRPVSSVELSSVRFYKKKGNAIKEIDGNKSIVDGVPTFSYIIRDGGLLDDDGLANGIITDPIYASVNGEIKNSGGTITDNPITNGSNGNSNSSSNLETIKPTDTTKLTNSNKEASTVNSDNNATKAPNTGFALIQSNPVASLIVTAFGGIASLAIARRIRG